MTPDAAEVFPAYTWARGLRDASVPLHIDMREKSITLARSIPSGARSWCTCCGGKTVRDTQSREAGVILLVTGHRDGCPWYAAFLRDSGAGAS